MFRKFRIVQNMINERDAHMLLDHLDKLFKRRKYEGNHWDAVIANYKEIELNDKNSNKEIKSILKPIHEWIQLETNTTNKSFLPTHAIGIRSYYLLHILLLISSFILCFNKIKI